MRCRCCVVVPGMVIVVVMVVAAGICTRFGIERGLDRVHVSAQPFHHLRDHMIGSDPNTILQQLDREMTVAEMPGDPNEFPVAMGVNFEQCLRLRTNPNHTTLGQSQPVAVAQANSLGQVDQHLPAGFGREHDTAPVATIEVDQDPIDRISGIPRAG
jgi:hypothetical protein